MAMSNRVLAQSREGDADLKLSDQHALTGLPENGELTLVDQLLAEQQSLTAVERFSRWHDREHATSRYSHLLPATPPGPGEQYRFEVNLDACTGCKACVSACHALNGLDDEEAWRDVGMLLGGRRKQDAYLQTVTSACHHCADPGCANGCPVAAYEKEKDTGIVRHLDDQCIGCQYCVLKCPYDVPKYSDRLGIVRKCDMCVGRLKEGEAPACVQACPTSAIKIRVVKKEELTFSTGAKLLPGAFDSSYTRPSTLYRTTKTMPKNTQPADAKALRLEHAHWPLVWMLVLTQMSAGIFAVIAGLLLAGKAVNPVALHSASVILNIGLAASVLHLGRPLGAWRFFLGLRTSWMSREILAFTLFAGAAVTSSALLLLGHLLPDQIAETAFKPTLISAGVLALVAVFTSVMIYVDTHRPFWKGVLTGGKFFGTAITLGMVCVAVVEQSPALMVAALGVRLALVAWEQSQMRQALYDDECPWHLSARVMKHKLPVVEGLKEAMFLLSIACGTLALAFDGAAMIVWSTLLILTSLAERLMERYMFFTAAMGPRMTGGYQE